MPSTDLGTAPLIPNHYTSSLSDLDLRIVRSVPPGGNWKNVPEDVPSRRIQQIRESYAAGKGSRSTYYGRLHPDAPSYTINTYFNRPGNGCHIHYEQDRVLSQREAARLQSFPDTFGFLGSRGAVNNQIGNAVPPLLAFQIARQLGDKGAIIDLFCGAGGLSLGFKWAGWHPIVATDFDRHATASYSANIHPDVVTGDIRDPSVLAEVVAKARESADMGSMWVLGGPPCQGFSTAGNRRSMNDQRNHLFVQYVATLSALRPAGFVFENVTGLLSMEGGRALAQIRSCLESVGYETCIWRLQAEQFGVPQRRTRVVIVGVQTGHQLPSPPKPLTSLTGNRALLGTTAQVTSAREALHDLPAISAGDDGSHLSYRCAPSTPYQALMRGQIEPSTFLQHTSGAHQ